MKAISEEIKAKNFLELMKYVKPKYQATLRNYDEEETNLGWSY